MIKEKKVLLDIDGVIADFSGHIFNYFNLEDKSPPTEWNDKRIIDNYDKTMFNDDFWLTIPRLIEPSEIKFKVSGYCTNRIHTNKGVTEKWLHDNGFPEAPIYVTDNKSETLKNIDCDIFFEDNIDNFNSINEAGIKCYLFDSSHNKDYKNDLRVYGFKDINVRVKPTILILGHKEHGKTTLSDLICKHSGYTSEDSSMACAKIFIYDELKEKYGYKSFEECYTDRRNKRVEWFNLISEYNRDNKTRLAEKILENNNIYVGMRRDFEVQASIDKNLFDIIISIYDPRKEKENIDSCDIDIFNRSDILIWNNESLVELENKVIKLFK